MTEEREKDPREFRFLTIQRVICLNFLNYLKNPYFKIIQILSKNSCNLLAIHNEIGLEKISSDSIKNKLRNLINANIVLKEDKLYKLSEFGKKFYKLIVKYELEDYSLNLIYLTKRIDKFSLLCRLALENDFINYYDLKVKYSDLGRKTKINQTLKYFFKKNFAERDNITKTYKISKLGKNIIDFYINLIDLFNTETEIGKELKNFKYSKFNLFLSNFDFSSLSLYNMFFITELISNNYNLRKGGIYHIIPLDFKKINNLLEELKSLNFIYQTKSKSYQIKNHTYIENIKNIKWNDENE
ncbi:MAG: hypothetical protein ACTSRZ_05950 [Promethearchaeota archaeon]